MSAPCPVVFDLDGTLIDSVPDIHAVAAAVLAAEGLAPQPLAQVRGFVGRGLPHLIERLIAAAGAPEDPERAARMIRAFEERYLTAVGLTRPYPGVEAALAALAGCGHPLAICTNKPAAAARAVLAHLRLDRFFPVLTGGDGPAGRKPDPAPLLATVAALGGGGALYVGDSGIDAETAARAGIPFLLFTEGYREAPAAALPHAAAFADFALLPGLVARHAAAAAAG